MTAERVRALLYGGRQAGGRQVTVAVARAEDGPRLTIGDADTSTDYRLADVRIDARPGSGPVLMHLAGGETLEVLDGNEFEAALEAAGFQSSDRTVRWLEGRWPYALVALVSVVFGSWAFVQFGVPALADRIVTLLPANADTKLGTSTLAFLDKSVFGPSALSDSRQDELRREFREIARATPSGSVYRLVFRSGGRLGPNAFALPSGVVVLTDELEKVAANDDELRAVFSHEIGHVVHRHAMRAAVRGSAIAALMLALFGDASSASPLIAGAPVAIVTAAYSRDFEREADTFSFQWMIDHHVSPTRLGDLLARLEAKHPAGSTDFLSSHPGLEERIRDGRTFQRMQPKR